jgi:hypothetical protein
VKRPNKRKSQNVAESERAKKPKKSGQSAPETQSSSSKQPAPVQVPAIQQPPTPAVLVTHVNDQNTEQPTSQRVANRAPLPDHETIRQATLTRVKQLDRTEITESNHAIFATVSKVVKQNRTTLHTQLLAHIANHIAGLKLPGLVRIQSSAESFYIVLFETPDQRDNAIDLIGKASFVVNNEHVPIVAHAFGDHSSKPNVIWTVAAGTLATTSSVRDAVIQHLRTHFPDFQTSFTVWEKMVYGCCNGEWAVRFDVPPPKFIKQMKIDNETFLIT